MQLYTPDSLGQPEESFYAKLKKIGSSDSAAPAMIVAAKPDEKKPKKLSFAPIIVILIFGIIYTIPILPLNPTAHTCLSILIGAALCWATEVVPSYITAYLVLGFSVWLGVGYNSTTGARYSASALASKFAARFMDPIILVFLGSLSMSAALTKLEITDRVSAFILSKISPKPKIVLASLMALNFVVASFLSNVASTTLVLTFSLPIIRSLDPDDPFCLALLLGLAWSGNAGGMTTTISSPQNILAIKYINDGSRHSVTFLEWIEFAVPSGLVLLAGYWGYLIFRFKPRIDLLPSISSNKEFAPWSWRHTLTCSITVLTIILWALQDTLSSVLGHVGITSIIPVAIFFSTGVLDSHDFGNLRWSTLVLMGGGLALGEAMTVSGLLDIISELFSSGLAKLSIWVVIVIICSIEAILTSVINHTSAAAILFPVLNGIGEKLGASTRLLVLSALMISCSQLFHISSFPNALISGVQKHTHNSPDQLTSESFLTGKDFFMHGWPMAIAAVLIIASVGYGIVCAMGYE